MNPIIWEPEVLDQIREIHFRAKQAVAGLTIGGHRSVKIARNIEFADYKEYTPGDPIRDVDWRVAARSDRLVIRRHQAESEMAVTLLVDASGDLGTGQTGGVPPGTKWAYVQVLAACLALLFQTRRDPVGLAILGGEDVPFRNISARLGRNHLANIVGTLAQTKPGGRADLEAGLSLMGRRLKRRTMVIMLSDLMEDPSSWGPMLGAFSSRKLDLRVAQIIDRDEWSMALPESARFYSPEGGKDLVVDPRATRRVFAEEAAAFAEQVRDVLVGNECRHMLVSTDESFVEVVGRLANERDPA